ncbi:MAG: VCBS repeat-containing protein, partial [Planctomycetes bacterium]|nr:VCBS repeat-containing protein [Planctomycetota bacterium]
MCFVSAILLNAQGIAADGPIVLRDITNQTGITFRHTDGGSGRHYIAETVCSGLATFDYNGDGLIDIYFLNGCPLRGNPSPERVTNVLYRNTGNFRFQDVTTEAGVGDPGYGMGVAVADYDNNGYPDLY